MTTLNPSAYPVRALGALLLGALAVSAHAQALPPAAPAAKSSPAAKPDVATAQPEETLILTPFEVAADSDKSYGALNSNSITRFNTELAHMPVSADIFNQAFMSDIGATSVEDMVSGFSAGAGNAIASSGASAANNQPGDRNANSFVSIRGLASPTVQLDGFFPINTYIQSGATGTGYTSNFNIERAEVIKGPQSLLYGVGGAGGVINLVSKQARFGQRTGGSFDFSVNQYGQKLALLDLSASAGNIALRFASTDQYAQGGRRLWIGGPMRGNYLQIAIKAGNTVVRLTGEKTQYDRLVGTTNMAYTALSTATDARNGQRLRYLLATGQLAASASGPSGGGNIGNGKINWDNVDSYASWWNQSEYNNTGIISATADSRWTDWLTTQVAVGYRDTYDDRVGNTITFAAPQLVANPTGQYAIGETGAQPLTSLSQPARTKAVRFSALFTNDLFGGKVHSQSIIGADFVRTDGVLITYAYVQADANFNPYRPGSFVPGTPGTPTNTASPAGYYYSPAQWYGVNNGPVRRPFFQPRTDRVTLNGINYVRVMANPPQKSLISPTNPEGLYTGGASALGDYRLGQNQSKGVYAANYTNWLDRKLDILLGVRAGNSYSVQSTESAPPSPPSTTSVQKIDSVNFNFGATYALTKWISPYFTASSSYAPPSVYVAGPLGDYPQAAKGTGYEVGVKISNPSKTLSGSLAVYRASSKNEESSLTSTLLFDINPSGLNGLYNAPSVWINVDRKTQGAEAVVIAQPTSNWMIRLSSAFVQGTVDSDRSFPQLYNDQFYANASGTVTYKDGTPVYVNGSGSGTANGVASTSANAVPLTLAKMNNPTDPYYANPLAVSGAISRSSVVGRVLLAATDVGGLIALHGPILTGATGLPISQMQINPGFKPAGTIITNVAGEQSVGNPKFSVVLTNKYTFSEGWARGLFIGGTASLAWQYRQYYYYPNGLADPANSPRDVFSLPTQVRFDGLLGYRRKIGRHYAFSTQLNIGNMFNRYHVLILPNYLTGWNGIKDATFDQQPRTWVWSSVISF